LASLKRGDNRCVGRQAENNVAPYLFWTATFALTAAKGPVNAGMKVFYSVLDDFGSVVTAEQVLQAAQSSVPR
jgi:hypothetical protein